MNTESVEISERKEKMTDKLQRRHDERIAEREKKRDELDVDESKKTSMEYFYKTFNEERTSIEKGLYELIKPDQKLTKVQLTECFDAFVHRLKKMQKFVSDYTLVLPSYDIDRSQTATNDLLSVIQQKRDEMMPKKKFAFKSRRKETDVSKEKVCKEKTKDDDVNSQKFEERFIQDSKGFSDRCGKTLELTPDEIKLQDVSLSNLKSCTVYLQGYPSAVHVNNLNDCKIFCGPVPGSIFADNCENCIFIIACQQLRVHHTKNTQFYLHVTSRAIIEDTSSVLFAPYNWDYPARMEDFAKSGLDENRNNWDDVDDFNWLASDKHSPNWGILPESQRIKDWK